MDDFGDRASLLRVTVTVCLDKGKVREWSGTVPSGAQVAEALRQADCETMEAVSVGIWGKAAALTQVLRDGDRVELYRPLTVDPKVARRERFARQGARTAGLFARDRNPGPTTDLDKNKKTL